MKKLILCFYGAVLAFASFASAEVLSLTQVNSNTWQIGVSGLPSGTNVGGFDVTLGFHSAVLSNPVVSFGSFLGDPNPVPASCDPADPPTCDQQTMTAVLVNPGTLQIQELSLIWPAELAGLQSESFPLATVAFTVGSGDPAVRILESSVSLSDQFGNPVEDTTVVPEPGSFALLASGLGLSFLVWRVRR